MSVPTTNDIFRTLRHAERPLTSIQVAAVLGANKERVSCQLSRLALYGKIDREAVRRRPEDTANPPRRWYVYSLKQNGAVHV